MLTYLALFLSMLGQPEPPNGPATKPQPDYPVQLRILETHWTRNLGTYTGYGRADLLGPDIRGLDFTFECSEPFLWNTLHGEFYQAKWKKPDQQLEILVQRVGSEHLSHCTLKTSLKSAPYSKTSPGWLKPLPAPATPAADTSPKPVAPPTPPPTL